ncbi:cytochrome P450 6A1-like [Lutzomyia longipalpis]|uniref:Cytochrome n=1 Tax=Lutzomyia longipalpis TaxID=7200 RepID=A0A1B0GH49_LUTLO|nr:cytochrome P450 6A1-like [Lutzomyia longipalpis]
MITTGFIYFLAAIISLGVLYVRRIYGYWQDRGVPFIEPHFPKGSISSLGKTEHFFEMIKRFYVELKGEGKPVGGTFFMTTPVAVALDLNFIKTILVKDFHYFHDRGFYVNERDDPLTANLLTIEGSQWRALRTKLSPSFTNGKMKLILPIIKDISDRFVQCLNEELCKREEINLSGYMSRFMMDIIASSAFGLDCNTLKDSNNEFFIMSQAASDTFIARTLKKVFMTSFKKLSIFLRLKVTKDQTSQYYTRIVEETMSYRDRNNVQRDDFLSMLMQLRNKGNLDGDSGNAKDSGKLTNNEIVANAFLFIIAGYHSSATTLEFCILELAHNAIIQENLRNEIRSVLEQHENMLSYNALMDMKYLDKVVNGKPRTISEIHY